MTREELLAELRVCPLVASVQASEGAAVDDPETLLKMAQTSVDQGVRVLRLQGVENIRTISAKLKCPKIGLIKRQYADTDVYITPSADEIRALGALGCEIIATDGTGRLGHGGSSLAERLALINEQGALAMADCDTLESALLARAAGADLIGTTLAGYTPASRFTEGPDFELLRRICETVKRPIIAEGRYSRKWEVESALRIGSCGVVVGGALNDPLKQTRAMMPSRRLPFNVGAVDIGATWMRFATFSPDWELLAAERTATPRDHDELLGWIRERVESTGVKRIGLGTAGVIDPATGEIWEAKESLMPGYTGIGFSRETLGVPTYAHGDGHATAWGHACHRDFAGSRVATLALGTGVGCGFVNEGRIWAGRRGEYPRVNDLPTGQGVSYEDLLGGSFLTPKPSAEQKALAVKALEEAVQVLRHLYFPDEVVIAGSVGLSLWMAPYLAGYGAVPSPFEGNAGMYGAAALALFPCTPEL